jgi:hypothetical protein
VDHDVLEARDGALPLGRQRLDAQLLHQSYAHAAHEHREAQPCEAIVEGLVRHMDAVLVIERAEQVGERFDLRARERGDNREKQPVRCHRPQPFGLPGGTTQVVDVLDGQGTGQGASDFDKLSGRQAGQWQSPLLLVSQPQHEAVVVPCRSPICANLSSRAVAKILRMNASYSLCSPRTMYRILDEAEEVKERRDQVRRPS